MSAQTVIAGAIAHFNLVLVAMRHNVKICKTEIQPPMNTTKTIHANDFKKRGKNSKVHNPKKILAPEIPDLLCPQFGIENPYMYAEKKMQIASAKFIALFDVFKKLAFHVPNEREKEITRMNLAKQGVKPGVSDWIILKPFTASESRFEELNQFCGKQYPYIAIELKANGGKLSEDQIAFLNDAHQDGAFCAVVWNLDWFERIVKWAYFPRKPFT